MTDTPDASPNADSDEGERLDALLARAENLMRSRDLEGAIASLTETAERFPDSPLPHHNLSVVYLQRLREDYEHVEVWEDLADDEAYFEQAVREAEMAIDIDSDFIPARNNLGTLFALRGWWADAIKQWETSLTVCADQSQIREEMLRARKRLPAE